MTSHRANILNQAADSIERNVRCQTHTEANGKNNAIDHLRRLAAEAQPYSSNPSVTTDRVLSQVLAERIRQDAQWGEQNHPDGTGPHKAAIVGALCFADEAAIRARRACQSAAQKGETTWRLVFAEESLEALAEDDPAKLRAELLQVAAVSVAWIEAIDRRTTTAEQLPTTDACGKCKKPFDPTDTAFDGRAQYATTPYCRHCVDLCHDNNSADHRCVICG